MPEYFDHTGLVDTRYRDIPFESVVGCWSPLEEEDRERWERECRGKPISLWTPPIPWKLVEEGFIYENGGVMLRVGPAPPCPSGCRGPFYTICGYEGTVCPHLVELGD